MEHLDEKNGGREGDAQPVCTRLEQALPWRRLPPISVEIRSALIDGLATVVEDVFVVVYVEVVRAGEASLASVLGRLISLP